MKLLLVNLNNKKKKKRIPDPIIVEDNYGHMKYIKESITAVKMLSDPDTEIKFDQKRWDKCVADPDFFRMYVDPMCMTLWMYKLQWDPIIYADRMVGVMTLAAEKEDPDARDKAMSNGGIRTFFDFDTQGYWKPCTLDTGHRETYIAEIVSFWVDRFVGFFHTPPVVPRYLTKSQLLNLANTIENDKHGDKEATRKLTSFLNLCGSPRQNETLHIYSEGVEGAHVGWSPFDLKGLNSERKRNGTFVRFGDIETEEELEKVRKEWFDVTSDSPVEERRKAMEIISIHLFSAIVGNLHKFDHNLFRAKGRNFFTHDTGPYIYIDNDRSQWKHKASKLSELKKLNPLGKICKFPTRISERILLLRTANANNDGKTLGHHIFSLSEKVYSALKNGPLFTRKEISVMDKNIDFIASMIDKCVDKHGADYVFVDEPWPQPDEYSRFLKSAYILSGKL